jgi:hypothetical protein
MSGPAVPIWVQADAPADARSGSGTISSNDPLNTTSRGILISVSLHQVRVRRRFRP